MSYQYPPPPPPSNVPPVRSVFQRLKWLIIAAVVVFLVIFTLILLFVIKVFDRVDTDMDDINRRGQLVITEPFDDQGAGIGAGGPDHPFGPRGMLLPGVTSLAAP